MIDFYYNYHYVHCYRTYSLSLPLTLPLTLPLFQAVEKSVKITQANYERTVSKVRTCASIFYSII